MLPGFRFLFATIVLAVSVLIFGLGAAALLRAAHEEFASLPSLKPVQPQYPALRSDPPPTLALLRVEPPETKPAESPGPGTRETVGAAEQLAPAPPPDKAASPDAARNALAKASDAEVRAQPAAPEVKSTESRTTGVATLEATATETSPPVISPPKLNAAAPPPSEAGLPDARTPEMASVDATDEATAIIVVQPAKPVVTKTRSLSARAIARRRMLARARAAERARALQQQQQQPQRRPGSDPFAQLFYGGARS